MKKNYYDELDIDKCSPQALVKGAFCGRLVRYATSNKDKKEELMRLNEAYLTLANPNLRATYDYNNGFSDIKPEPINFKDKAEMTLYYYKNSGECFYNSIKAILSACPSSKNYVNIYNMARASFDTYMKSYGATYKCTSHELTEIELDLMRFEKDFMPYKECFTKENEDKTYYSRYDRKQNGQGKQKVIVK